MLIRIRRLLSGLIYALWAGYALYAVYERCKYPQASAAQLSDVCINGLITAVFILVLFIAKGFVSRIKPP